MSSIRMVALAGSMMSGFAALVRKRTSRLRAPLLAVLGFEGSALE
jgi:hypothetical protein